ncbi:MAG: hypothetical protein COB41_09880 [Proteobacteria bacterium]|nr:MAG: hypothetical protein COB41_09880 [Pseudomonadota bacterium]
MFLYSLYLGWWCALIVGHVAVEAVSCKFCEVYIYKGVESDMDDTYTADNPLMEDCCEQQE